MTATDKAADPSAPPALEKDWRFYAGMTAMALAVIMPLCALLVPVLAVPTQSALLAGVLFAGGPRCCASSRSRCWARKRSVLRALAKTALRRA